MNYFFFLTIAFLNAFVDIGHKISLQNVIFFEYSGNEQVFLISLINIMILIPFILLFSPASFLSDKFPKNKIIKYGSLSAILITSLIFISYYYNLFWISFSLTVILAAQSAIYSPAKLGYIRDLVRDSELSKLNAYIQSISMIAILSSMFYFSLMFDKYYVHEEGLRSISFVALILVFLSIIEFTFSLKLPTKTEKRNISFELNKWFNLTYLKTSLKEFNSNEIIQQSMIGLAIFWLIIQIMAVSFPSYAKDIGLNSVTIINAMLATTGIGIFFGSLFYTRLSKNYIEVGTVPFSAIIISFSIYLITTTNNIYILFSCFLIAGIAGGLFIVPLNALIQYHSKRNKLGQAMSGANWIQSLLMFIGLTITTIVAYIGIDSKIIMISLSIISFISAIYTVYKIPQSLIYFLISRIFQLKYKLQVSGLDNIPSTGPVLLLGNHVSWIDWALLQMSSPRRIRFLMDRHIYEKWYLKRFLDFFGVIPSTGKDSLKLIAEYLDKGEVVCIFPEGVITRNGQLSEFKKSFEKVLELTTTNVSVIPFYIRGIWGDKFSRAGETLKNNFDNNPIITVIFGKHIENANSFSVKQAVLNLSAESWKVYSETLKPIHIEILHRLRKSRNKLILVDSTGLRLTGEKVLTAAILFKEQLKNKLIGQNIGLLLPSTGGGVLANLAVLMNGKTLVNLNYTASISAIKSSLDQANIETIITSEKFLKKLKTKGINLEELLKNKNIVYLEKEKKDIPKIKSLIIFSLIKIMPEKFIQICFFKKVNTNSTAVILFSSGSEGDPKGVELTHKNIVGNIKQIVNILNPNKNDSLLGILPMFHAFGITVTTFLPLVEGLLVVNHPDPTDAVTIGKLVKKYEVTIMTATSTFLRIYTANKRVHPLMFSSLRLVIAGAEKLDLNVRNKFKEKFNKDILEGYGATETSPVATVNIPDIMNSDDYSVQVGSKLGTVGLPIPGTNIKIVDPDTFEELPVDKEGLILITGPQIMKSYLNNAEKTYSVLKKIDNIIYYITLDKGFLDKDSFLTIVDRYSRFAKLSGEMISLTAVEQEIALVIEDFNCIAVNIPDNKKGEKIVLVYEKSKIKIEDIKKLIRNSFSNKLMIPSEYFEVEELPKLGTGKKDFKTAKQIILNKNIGA